MPLVMYSAPKIIHWLKVYGLSLKVLELILYNDLGAGGVKITGKCDWRKLLKVFPKNFRRQRT
jgi:hypothetical protein